MKYYVVTLFLISIAFIACNKGKEKNEIEFVDYYDVVDTQEEDSLKERLKKLEYTLISNYYYNHYIKSEEKQVADIDKFQLKSFTRIKWGIDYFTYFYQKIDSIGPYDSYLIFEDSDVDKAIWLANYDSVNNKLIDALEIYYNEPEGSFKKETYLYPYDSKIIQVQSNDFTKSYKRTVHYGGVDNKDVSVQLYLKNPDEKQGIHLDIYYNKDKMPSTQINMIEENSDVIYFMCYISDEGKFIE